jgi:RsiW-degrading membrane proteinase PrsW (M82 family)
MVFLIAVALSFIPAFVYAWVVYWIDRYEKEPLPLLGGVFLWGAIVATLGALIASIILEVGVLLVTGSEVLADITGTTVIAPLVEESLKGFAVLIVFVVFRREFDSILDGIVYAGITALGFAATENVLYLYFQGYAEGGGMEGLLTLFFLRVILGGWNHAVYTACIGIGLAVARFSHKATVKLFAPIIGWFMAVTIHGIHNSMAIFLGGAFGLGGLAATIAVDWLSWVIMFAIILWALSREKKWIVAHLPEEVERGIITQQQFQTARSTWAQSAARARALFRGRYGTTRRFYQLCAELAQKKHQLATMGEEKSYSAATVIEKLRQQLGELSPKTG